MKRSANTWPRLTLVVLHPHWSRSGHSLVHMCTRTVEIHKADTPNFWRSCERNKANIVVCRNRAWRVRVLRQGLILEFLYLAVFCVFIDWNHEVRFSSAQMTLSAVSDHAVRFSSAQVTLSAMSNYFVTLWTAALQVSPSIIHSQSLLIILMPFESMVLSNRIIFCHLLSSPTFSPSQHQGLFQLVSSLHQVAKVLECQCQHHFLQWIFMTDFL